MNGDVILLLIDGLWGVRGRVTLPPSPNGDNKETESRRPLFSQCLGDSVVSDFRGLCSVVVG
jgi:hypothetical protein